MDDIIIFDQDYYSGWLMQLILMLTDYQLLLEY